MLIGVKKMKNVPEEERCEAPSLSILHAVATHAGPNKESRYFESSVASCTRMKRERHARPILVEANEYCKQYKVGGMQERKKCEQQHVC